MRLLFSILTFLIFIPFCLYPQEKSIESIEKIFERGNYENVIHVLTKEMLKRNLSAEFYERGELLLALSYLKCKKEYIAIPHFEELLRYNPEYNPEIDLFDEHSLEVFIQTRKDIIGYFNLYSFPGNEEIFIDGRAISKYTPLIYYPLVEGTHEIILLKNGYNLSQQRIEITAGDTIDHTIKMAFSDMFGVLFVKTQPPGTEVYLDDGFQGYTPLVVGDLLSGDYKITLNQHNYHSYEDKISIERGKIKKYNVKLERIKDDFIWSELVPGLGQFKKGYKKHGILFTSSFIALTYYWHNFFKTHEDPKSTKPDRNYRAGLYYVNGEEVCYEEYIKVIEDWENEYSCYTEKKHRVYLTTAVLYAINIIDVLWIIKRDIKRKEREEQERFSFDWKPGQNGVKIYFKVRF